MFRRIFHPMFYCETPDTTGGGGTATTAPGVQPTPGQGSEPTSNDGFWNTFPDVPEEQRSLLEPHLRRSQGEITRLQQSQATLRPLLESGYQPQQLQGLVQFDQRFQQAPVDVWLEMAEMLQKQGIVHGDLDLEALKAVASGQEFNEETETPEGNLPPEVAAYIQRLEAKIDQIDGNIRQNETRQQQAVQDRFLAQQKAKMKAELVKVGYSDEQLTDQRLNSFILTHGGNVQSAIQDLQAMRSDILKGFTQQRQTTDPLETRNGGPQAPSPRPSQRDARDPFAKARAGAHNRLARANRDAAQG